MLNIKILQALQGDCIIITYGEVNKPHYILIDSGMGKVCFRELDSFLKEIKQINKKIDLIVLTHYDNDHIQGFLNLSKYSRIDSNSVKQIWMNYGTKLSEMIQSQKTLQFSIKEVTCETSSKQGKEFYEYIMQKGIDFLSMIMVKQEYDLNNAKIKILSPSIEQIEKLIEDMGVINEDSKFINDNQHQKETSGIINDFEVSIEDILKKRFYEDISVTNCSSIAFLFEYKTYKILFLGDSVPSQIVKELQLLGYNRDNKLKLDYCKISHHGSNFNTSDELIKLLDCQNYIISSNWSKNRPGKECLSRIVAHSENPVCFLCNYPPEEVFTDIEKKKYHISFRFLANKEIILED